MDKRDKNYRFSIEWCLFMDKVIKKPKRLPLLLGVFLAAGASAVGLAGVFEDHEGDQAGKDYADQDVGPCRCVVALDAGPHLQKGFGVGVVHDAAAFHYGSFGVEDRIDAHAVCLRAEEITHIDRVELFRILHEFKHHVTS